MIDPACNSPIFGVAGKAFFDNIARRYRSLSAREAAEHRTARDVSALDAVRISPVLEPYFQGSLIQLRFVRAAGADRLPATWRTRSAWEEGKRNPCERTKEVQAPKSLVDATPAWRLNLGPANP